MMPQERLMVERKKWRKDHPQGFYLRPKANADGSTNILEWEGGIPGKPSTPWEGGVFRVKLVFSNNYPSKAPDVYFTPRIFHPNVYGDGKICLSILNDSQDWRPSITVKQIMLGVQDLLETPNVRSPAQLEANNLYMKDRTAYDRKVRALVKKNHAAPA